MTDINKLIEELTSLEKKATKGPWKLVDLVFVPKDCDTWVNSLSSDPHKGIPVCQTFEPDSWTEDDNGNMQPDHVPNDDERIRNLCLISKMRNALPLLLEEIKRLREEKEKWKHLATVADDGCSLADAEEIDRRYQIEIGQVQSKLHSTTQALEEALEVIRNLTTGVNATDGDGCFHIRNRCGCKAKEVLSKHEDGKSVNPKAKEAG